MFLITYPAQRHRAETGLHSQSNCLVRSFPLALTVRDTEGNILLSVAEWIGKSERQIEKAVTEILLKTSEKLECGDKHGH